MIGARYQGGARGSRLTGTSQADDVGFNASRTRPASHPRATSRHANFVTSELVVSHAHFACTSRAQRRDAQRTRAPTRAIQTERASAVPEFPHMVGRAARTEKRRREAFRTHAVALDRSRCPWLDRILVHVGAYASIGEGGG